MIDISFENTGQNVQTIWVDGASSDGWDVKFYDYRISNWNEKCVFTVNPGQKKTFECVSNILNSKHPDSKTTILPPSEYNFKFSIWSKEPCINYQYFPAGNNGKSGNFIVKKYDSCNIT